MSASGQMMCACKLQMHRNAKGLYYCVNCDLPQKQEFEIGADGRPSPRKTTMSDRRFHLEWASRMRQHYGNAA